MPDGANQSTVKATKYANVHTKSYRSVWYRAQGIWIEVTFLHFNCLTFGAISNVDSFGALYLVMVGCVAGTTGWVGVAN